jgi:hypothetical protein
MQQSWISKLPPRGQHRGFRCHALPAIPLGQQSDVFLHLRLKL